MTICHKLDVIPDLLAVHARKPDTYPYLLASNTRGNENSRYSILMAHPQEITTQFGAEDDCLCNSVRGVCPVVAIDERLLAIGATTRKMMTALNRDTKPV